MSAAKRMAYFYLALGRCRCTRVGCRRSFDFRAGLGGRPDGSRGMRDLAGAACFPSIKSPIRSATSRICPRCKWSLGDYAAADVAAIAARSAARADAGRPVSLVDIRHLRLRQRPGGRESNAVSRGVRPKSFHEVVARLSDHDAYAVTRWLKSLRRVFQDCAAKSSRSAASQDSIEQWRGGGVDAEVPFLRRLSKLWTPGRALIAEDDQRRYTADDEILIKTSGGREHCGAGSAEGSRPRVAGTARVHDLRLAELRQGVLRLTAMSAWWRTRAASPREIPSGWFPYQHDGDDARAVINWIAKQPWSDGRVGMYGDGYSGFAAWAAAKRLPPALKAIATSSAPSAPGIDVPMGGSIFQNSAYRWSSYVTNTKERRRKEAITTTRCGARSIRSGTAADGATVIWAAARQAQSDIHPLAESSELRSLLAEDDPLPEQFAHINIPVLTTTGYYAGANRARCTISRSTIGTTRTPTIRC
jgi:hypothetical protein